MKEIIRFVHIFSINMPFQQGIVNFIVICFAFRTQFVRTKSDFTGRVPIGALFEKIGNESLLDRMRPEVVQATFNEKVRQINDQQSRVMIQISEVKTNMESSYHVVNNVCKWMKDGIFALFTTHRMATLNTITSYSKTYRLPFITPGMAVNTTGQEFGYGIFMKPYYSKVLLDVMVWKGWKKFTYVFHSQDSLHRMQQLFDEIQIADVNIETDMRQLHSPAAAFKLLKQIYSEDKETEKTHNLILDLGIKDVQALFDQQRKESWAPRTSFDYLLVSLGIEELEIEEFERGGLNVTGLSVVNRQGKMKNVKANTPHNKLLTCDEALVIDSVEVIYRALKSMVDKSSNIFRSHASHGSNRTMRNAIDCQQGPVVELALGYELLAALRKVDFMGLTGRIAFDKFGLRTEYTMTILQSDRNRALRKVATWTERDKVLKDKPIRVQPSRPEGNEVGKFKNRTFIITSILTEPYLMLKESDENGNMLEGNDRYEGYCADLAKQIAKKLEFDYKIVTVKDKGYGTMDENGTWNGMVGELIRGEADICIAPLTITAQREEAIDFSKPFMSLGITIMILKPTKEKPGVFSFMYPLSNEIWMCVVFAYIGVSVVLFLVSRFSPFEWHIEDNTDGPSITNNFTIFNSLWFSLGAFMQQGCDIEPRSMSGRIVGSVWWFFTLIVISSYTANLAAFLTVERMQSPIESADDLAKQTEIKYGSVASGSTREFFRTASIAVYERMWAFMSSAEPSVFVSQNAEGVARVRGSKGKYAFLAESTTIEYVNQQEPCDTMKVGSNLDSKGYGIATPIGSDLRNSLNLEVLVLRESGELARLFKKWWFEKSQCGNQNLGSKDDTANSLKLASVAGLFYILLSGLLLAIFMAFVEFLYKSKMEARRRNTTFVNAVRSKARLSIKGKPDSGKQAMSYSYAPAAQLVSLDGYTDANNTHTQV